MAALDAATLALRSVPGLYPFVCSADVSIEVRALAGAGRNDSDIFFTGDEERIGRAVA
jgi:hypothetical protein